MPAIQMASRISYIVGQDGKITFVHDDMNAATHVKSLLAAIGQ
jgi:peroxiredoxin